MKNKNASTSFQSNLKFNKFFQTLSLILRSFVYGDKTIILVQNKGKAKIKWLIQLL